MSRAPSHSQFTPGLWYSRKVADLPFRCSPITDAYRSQTAPRSIEGEPIGSDAAG
jgi:hypothetical protein